MISAESSRATVASPLLRALASERCEQEGRELMIARDLMTPDPVTVTPQASIAEVWDLMREVEVRHVPVVQGGALVGMLSDRDLARVDMATLLKVEGADALRQELATPIAQIMTSDVIAVEPDTEVGDVIALLLDHKIGALPVVEAGTREVLGIISYVDVLRALQGLLEEED
jgi:acetoin utilization protein AcuB